MNLRSEYPILGLIANVFPYRIPGANFGKYTSIVLLAPCNFACPYCDMGGYDKDEYNNLPGHRNASLDELESFVREQCALGRIIYFSGGEPTLFPELLVHLGKIVRSVEGSSVVATNASLWKWMSRISPYVDEFSVSLKGLPECAEMIAGAPPRLAFNVPHRNAVRMQALPNRLEFLVVLFDCMEPAEIAKFYAPFVGRVHITLKEFRSKVSVAKSDHTYQSTPLESLVHPGVSPMNRDRMVETFELLKAARPDQAASVTLVTGTGGETTVLYGGERHLIHRLEAAGPCA